jgi:formylglycine-generating enzyme required for sulfatase activity
MAIEEDWTGIPTTDRGRMGIYAARAGSTTNYPWGNAIDCKKASYDGGLGSSCYYKTGRQSFRGTQSVGRSPPNGWGLYDMHATVWQWCEDSWHPDYRDAPVDGTGWQGGDESMSILRGGAWNYGPSGLRSAPALANATVQADRSGRRYYAGLRLWLDPARLPLNRKARPDIPLITGLRPARCVAPRSDPRR